MSINSQNTYLNIEDAHLRLRTGNVYAQGINIGGITVDTAHGLQRVSDTGNVTSNTLQFANATTAFVTTANVTVGRDLTVTGNATVSSNLTVTGNALISDDLTVTENLLVSNNLTVTGNLNVTGNTFYTNPAAVLVDSNVVTEYTGPHDRPLRKYPEVKFPLSTSSESPAIGATTFTYKSYTVTGNSVYNDANSKISRAFDGEEHVTSWTGNLGDYDSNGDVASGKTANYLQIQLPNAIKLEKIKIISDGNYEYANGPRNITLYGSNNGSNWVTLKSETDLPLNGGTTNPDPQTTFVHVNTTTKYLYYKLEISKIWISSGGATYARIGEWELYGYEEGSASLDTTLKSVYNVPATTGTQLEVYYDGQDYSDMPTVGSASVIDKAGGDQNGTPSSGVSFDSTYKAFVFDGTTNGKITTSIINDSGDWVHSASVWVKVETGQVVATTAYISLLGTTDSAGTRIAFDYKEDESAIRLGINAAFVQWNNVIVPNQWHHITYTYKGGSISGENYNLYVDGKYVEYSTLLGTSTLTLAQNTTLSLGQSHLATNYLKGSIANFRLYSKVLNAGQVQELYDYQKDYFLGSKSQVTLYKGHLGVGVTEPSGQLELAGDERIQEYPPRGLVGDELVYDPAGNAYDYNVEGHGVFKLLSSVKYHNGTGSNDRRIYKLFDKSNDTLTHWSSFNSSDPYDAAGGSGAWVTTLDGGSTITAHIAEIQMPYKITLKKYILTSSSQVPRALKTGMIVGSNDGNVFHVLHNVPDFGFTATYQPKEYTVDNTTTPYRIFRLLLMNTNGHQTCNMNEWRLFGTPGPTTLDKGSLSLTRSLDVPRVSRYDVDTETPRPEKLVVDFDTTVNSSPTDISGQGNHGAFYNGAYYSAVDKAFSFDGSNDSIRGIISNPAGDWVHSISFWFKLGIDQSAISGRIDPFSIGRQGTGGVNRTADLPSDDIIGHYSACDMTPTAINWYFFGNDASFSISGIKANEWHHLTFAYEGSGAVASRHAFLDGVEYPNVGTSTAPLAMFANSILALGVDFGRVSSSPAPFNGQLSNFKIYNAYLEPSEVKKLYNLGRTGRSMVISDTAVGIGKVPEAQLDVRGVLKASVGIFQDRPFFACDVANFGLKDNGSQTIYQHSGRTDTLTAITETGCRWKLGITTGNHTYKTNNVQLVRVLNDTTSETSGVKVPYAGYYHLVHLLRTININAGASFWVYSPRHNKYIQPSIGGDRVPWGGNNGHDYIGNSVSASLYLEEGDVVIFVLNNVTVSQNPASGGFEQFVSLVML